MAAAKTTRPDLSWITSQSFQSVDEYKKWHELLTEGQKLTLMTFQYGKLPNLIVCAEMLFDSNIQNPDSPVFQIVSETLNEK